MKRVIYCFLSIVACLVLICGCQPTPPKRAAFFSVPFCTEIAGEIRGIEFSAKLVREAGEGRISVEYLSPDALASVTVQTRLDADGSFGERVAVAKEGMVTELPLAAAEGLLLPMQILLTCAQTDAATVQKEENGYRFTFSDGTILSLSPSGIPQSVVSPDLSYQIVWWESRIGDSQP
ncbi:MAG: hypothetical protein IKJ35_02800 [Clostridia bacterium]|nr:hypothetical protein [Clostridia bacterium]